MPDIKVGTDGDFVLDKGDLDITDTDAEALRQDILFRLQTDMLDYQPQPSLGIGLHQFIGQPNTEALADDIQQVVTQALVTDDKFPATTLQVEVVPIGVDKLAIFIFHVPRNRPAEGGVTVEVVLDLTAGTITPITG